MFTIETYSTTARKYKTVRTARTRLAAILALSLVKGRARVRNSEGKTLFTRTETDGNGKLSRAA